MSAIAGIPYQFDHPLIVEACRRVAEQVQQRYAPLGFTFDNRLAAEVAHLESHS